MGNQYESGEQFGQPKPSNKLDNGRTNATKGSATPKAASFKTGKIDQPSFPGSFKGREAVNPAQAKGFSSKRPSGLDAD